MRGNRKPSPVSAFDILTKIVMVKFKMAESKDGKKPQIVVNVVFFCFLFFVFSSLKSFKHIQCELNKVQISKRSSKDDRIFTSQINNSLRTENSSSPRFVGVMLKTSESQLFKQCAANWRRDSPLNTRG